MPPLAVSAENLAALLGASARPAEAAPEAGGASAERPAAPPPPPAVGVGDLQALLDATRPPEREPTAFDALAERAGTAEAVVVRHPRHDDGRGEGAQRVALATAGTADAAAREAAERAQEAEAAARNAAKGGGRRAAAVAAHAAELRCKADVLAARARELRYLDEAIADAESERRALLASDAPKAEKEERRAEITSTVARLRQQRAELFRAAAKVKLSYREDRNVACRATPEDFAAAARGSAALVLVELVAELAEPARARVWRRGRRLDCWVAASCALQRLRWNAETLNWLLQGGSGATVPTERLEEGGVEDPIVLAARRERQREARERVAWQHHVLVSSGQPPPWPLADTVGSAAELRDDGVEPGSLGKADADDRHVEWDPAPVVELAPAELTCVKVIARSQILEGERRDLRQFLADARHTRMPGVLEPTKERKARVHCPLAGMGECNSPTCGCSRGYNSRCRPRFQDLVVDAVLRAELRPPRIGGLCYGSVGCGTLYFDLQLLDRLVREVGLPISRVVLVDTAYTGTGCGAELQAFANWFPGVQVFAFGHLDKWKAACEADAWMRADVLIQADAVMAENAVTAVKEACFTLGGVNCILNNKGPAKAEAKVYRSTFGWQRHDFSESALLAGVQGAQSF